MSRFSICPHCGEIVEWPGDPRAMIFTCIKCKARNRHPMAGSREDADTLARSVKRKENSKT